MLELIVLMSSLFWRLSKIKVLSSWVWVVAIWAEEKIGRRVCTKNITGEGYHDRWGKERNPKGYVENKGVGKGGWDHREKW
jgi:hypothetical protein